jgi:outer membrane protein assembly factor BamB
MHQPDWDFTKDHQADFGSEKDPFTAYGSPILVDLDNDGVEEILIAGCFGGLGVLREDYSIVWWMRTPFTDTMLRLPGIADLNGDGRLCVGIGRANGVFTCLDGATGAELWTLALGSTTTDTVSCDIDGDGREEFITGTTDGRILALGTGADGKGEIRWSVNLGFAMGNPVVADVDGDGTSEVLALCGDGHLVCIGKDR